MAKPTSILIKMVSSADTGFYYVTRKNPRTKTEKMELKKYDPVVRKHVVFKELKMKRRAVGLLRRVPPFRAAFSWGIRVSSWARQRPSPLCRQAPPSCERTHRPTSILRRPSGPRKSEGISQMVNRTKFYIERRLGRPGRR